MKAEMPDFLTDRFFLGFVLFFIFFWYPESRFLCQYSKAEFKKKTKTKTKPGLLGQVLLGIKDPVRVVLSFEGRAWTFGVLSP